VSFDNLSQGMTPDEKRDLLARIQLSLNLSARDTESISSKAGEPEDLKRRLSGEFKKLGLFERFILKIAAFFSGRAEYELLGDRKLGSARAILRERVPDLMNVARGEWTAEFAKLLYDLYAEAVPARPVFDHLFQQKMTLEAGLVVLIRDEFPSAAKGLNDLLTDGDITQIYRTTQKRSSVKVQLDSRLGQYLEQIPPSTFDNVRDRLKPLYFLRPLVQFPYPFLFELFGHNAEGAEVNKYPFFTGAPWRKTAGLLERLYYGLYLAGKFDGAIDLGQLFRATAERLGGEWTADSVHQRVSSLLTAARALAQKLPWKEILQWSFQDPYYGVKYSLPQYSVKDFYQTTLAIQLGEELDDRFPEVREQLLAEEQAELFQSAVDPIEFYVEGLTSGTSAKVNGFQYPKTLALLWQFLGLYFAKRIHPFFQSLARLVPPANKSVLQVLSSQSEELVALRQKIQAFDHSLHTDGQEGQQLERLKYELNTKALGLKPFVQFVQSKDALARELIQRGIDGLDGLHRQFVGLKDRNVPVLKSILKLPFLLDGRQETVENGLDRIIVLIEKALFVLKETLSLEE
jgi:hypothetical protein